LELYQLNIAYDGTDFAGFQRQGEKRTVQLEIERGLRLLGWTGKSILSASRTDSGVHASGQVIACELNWQHGVESLKNALNDHLPNDISVLCVSLAKKGFHPRFDARSRRYVYHLIYSHQRHPIKERYAWRVWPEADLQLLSRCAKSLKGDHDFAYLGCAINSPTTTKRMIFFARWFKEEHGSKFEICANALLYHMIRRLVFLQVKVGQGEISFEDWQKALDHGASLSAGIAPAHGLELAEVSYLD